MASIVILGGGVGGLVAANTLRRRLDRKHRIILIDRRGRYGFAYSTPKMAFAYAESSGKVVAHIKKG